MRLKINKVYYSFPISCGIDLSFRPTPVQSAHDFWAENMQESQNIYFSKQVLSGSKVLGFSTVTIRGQKSTTSCYDIFFFTANVVFGFFILGLSVIKKNDLMTSESAILNYGSMFSQVSTVIIAITLMINSFICRHRLWKTILTIDETDKKVKSLKKIS